MRASIFVAVPAFAAAALAQTGIPATVPANTTLAVVPAPAGTGASAVGTGLTSSSTNGTFSMSSPTTSATSGSGTTSSSGSGSTTTSKAAAGIIEPALGLGLAGALFAAFL